MMCCYVNSNKSNLISEPMAASWRHEPGGFNAVVENLNYTPAGLVASLLLGVQHYREKYQAEEKRN